MKKYLFILTIYCLPLQAWAQTDAMSDRRPDDGSVGSGLGGPASISGQLKEDNELKLPSFRFPEIDHYLQPWFDWKKALDKKYGLKLGTDYSVLYQRANDVLSGDKNAMSGVFRLYGNWALVGRGTKNYGSLVFKIEHRHKMGSDGPPSAFAGNIGYQGVTGLLYSDVKDVLVDLNWQQRLNGGRAGFIAG